MNNNEEIYHAPPELRIGHIHLKVADIERSVAFYRDIMGFDLLFNIGTAAFLSVGGYHHHIGLNTWHSEGAGPAPKQSTGLYHFALNYPTRKDLAKALKRLVKNDYPLRGSSDHHSHLAIYLDDPDGNGIELAWDKDPSFWTFMIDGTLTKETVRAMNKPFDLKEFIKEAE
jgi:catechol 2,3-dioxygenase